MSFLFQGGLEMPRGSEKLSLLTSSFWDRLPAETSRTHSRVAAAKATSSLVRAEKESLKTALICSSQR